MIYFGFEPGLPNLAYLIGERNPQGSGQLYGIYVGLQRGDHMGTSINRGPQNRPQYIMVLIVRTTKMS